jgi:hypothetical protein
VIRARSHAILVFTQVCLQPCNVWKTLLTFTPKAGVFSRSNGLSVSALIAEKTTATATVIANC